LGLNLSLLKGAKATAEVANVNRSDAQSIERHPAFQDRRFNEPAAKTEEKRAVNV